MLNRVDANGLLACYAGRVDCFDHPAVGHDVILKDEQAFRRCWPMIGNRLASDIAAVAVAAAVAAAVADFCAERPAAAGPAPACR